MFILICLISLSKLHCKEDTVIITVTSTAFKDGEMIPSRYTCDGANISPQIAWTNIPHDTKSIAIISDDPDAPVGTWVHWIVYDIPPDVTELQENCPPDKILKNGAKQGITDFKRIGYGGPCPPSGTHRYFFKAYALDILLNAQPGLTKANLLKAMDGHIIAKGQLIGKYERK